MKCANCYETLLCHQGNYSDIHNYMKPICQNCPERKLMPNIKITAEVDGKQVPLENISTEIFEAIKALEKPKEIPVPVARIGNYKGWPNERRLFLRINEQLRETIVNNKHIRKVTIDLKDGNAVWRIAVDNATRDDEYENIRPL